MLYSVIFLPSLLASFFLFLLDIPFCRQTLRLLLLPENNRDRIETLTWSAEWPQFVVDHFSGNITYFSWGGGLGRQTFLATAADTL